MRQPKGHLITISNSESVSLYKNGILEVKLNDEKNTSVYMDLVNYLGLKGLPLNISRNDAKILFKD